MSCADELSGGMRKVEPGSSIVENTRDRSSDEVTAAAKGCGVAAGNRDEALLRAIADLDELKKTLTGVFEVVPVPLLTICGAGRIELQNRACEAFLGDDRSRTSGRLMTDLFVESDHEKLRRALRQACEAEAPASVEVGLEHAGIRREVLVRCALLNDCVGSPKLLHALIDITDSKRQQLMREAFFLRFRKLTRRERDVLRLALAGLSNKDISERLDISIRTIETHRSRIMVKAGVDSLLDLIRKAAAAGVSSAEMVPPVESATQAT